MAAAGNVTCCWPLPNATVPWMDLLVQCTLWGEACPGLPSMAVTLHCSSWYIKANILSSVGTNEKCGRGSCSQSSSHAMLLMWLFCFTLGERCAPLLNQRAEDLQQLQPVLLPGVPDLRGQGEQALIRVVPAPVDAAVTKAQRHQADQYGTPGCLMRLADNRTLSKHGLAASDLQEGKAASLDTMRPGHAQGMHSNACHCRVG